MGTFTSQILIGQKHSYEGGLINISHILYLSENDRPAWVLTSANIEDQRSRLKKKVWIPTLENMLEDALLMIGLYVLKDEKLVKLAKQSLQYPDSDYIELYKDIDSDQLQELYIQARKIEASHKIVLSVFHGSSIMAQLPVLKDYRNDIEVCSSVYRKERSVWSGEYGFCGEL